MQLRLPVKPRFMSLSSLEWSGVRQLGPRDEGLMFNACPQSLSSNLSPGRDAGSLEDA